MRDADGLSREYALLTPEERFRLVLAASGRGDEAERDRLVRAGGKLVLSFPGHAPFAQAFNEIAHLTFIELVEAAAFFNDAIRRASAHGAALGELKDEDVGGVGEGEVIDGPEGAEGGRGPDATRLPQGRGPGLALAAGYMLKAKAEGWALFCSPMGVPPMLLWEGLPGFERLRRSLGLAQNVSFAPEGFLEWLNRDRPEGDPELTTTPWTPESVAAATEKAFRLRVEWWGG